MLRVRLGISEIDSYNMLFYSHYLRYNERAANTCLSPESSSAVLCRVSLAKSMSSVRWNDTVDIRTTVAPSAEGQSVQGECTLLHEWFVAEQYEKPAYLSLCTYAVCGPAGFTGARTPDARGGTNNPITGTLSASVKEARDFVTSANSIGAHAAALYGTTPPMSRSGPFGKLLP